MDLDRGHRRSRFERSGIRHDARLFFLDFMQIPNHIRSLSRWRWWSRQRCHRRVETVKVITASWSSSGISYGFYRHWFFCRLGLAAVTGEEERIAAGLFVRLLQLFFQFGQRLLIPRLLRQQTLLLRLQQRQRVWSEAILLAPLLVAQLYGHR